MVAQTNNPSFDTFRKKLDKFIQFLKQSGAEVLVPTNEWEMLRFDSHKGIGVVYFNKRRELRFTGQAKKAWDAYCTAGAFEGAIKGKRGILTPRVKTLLERDGDCCFLCHLPLGDDITVEHLCAVVNGGPKHISNLVLAHDDCNKKLGHLSVMEKIKMRERNRPAPELGRGVDVFFPEPETKINGHEVNP